MADTPTTPAPAPESDPGEKMLTQTQVNSLLAEQKRKLTASYADYDELKQKASRVDALEQELSQATSKVGELEPTVTRLQVALAKGLPAELAERLRGSTEEELSADADQLLALIPSGDEPRRPAPDPSQGGNGGAPGLNEDRLLSTVKTKLGID